VVNEALGGTDYVIEWNEFYGGSLAPVGGELEALEAGLADVGIVPTVFEPSNLPLQNVTYLTPFGATDPTVVSEVMNELHETIPAMIEAWDRFDIEYLGAGFALDNYMLMTTFPLSSLADLRGRRIGAPGPAVNWLDGTGAVGVSGNLTTYYNDIQTGVYEGVIVFPTAAAPANLEEVAPFITLIDFGAQYAGTLVANKTWFSIQPDEVKQALQAGAQAYNTRYVEALTARVDASLQAMIEGGATVTQASSELRTEWANALPNIPQVWVRGLDAQGLPGDEVLTTYLQNIRDRGVELPRNWDQE
jgi:TRAP-type C4-dicarboxylate transport system substrate-binding protein